ncbi:MAG: lantibiotic dehydratase, partial [Myxococcaceae bacterium]|nr:lantibiotic dehydratase [Myxococcaceae bacterium]
RRYEGREVRLVEVLDEELGIGFNAVDSPLHDESPLLDGIVLPGRRQEASERARTTPEVMLRRLDEALRSGSREIVLDEGDLRELERREPAPLPRAFALVLTLLGSPEKLDAGEARLYFRGLLGPSGAEYLGRFCHGAPGLAQYVREHLRAEEAHDPEAVYAEVVHLPQGRIGNILLRPCLRDYEIVFLGRSGAPSDRQIAVTDLWVSNVGGELVLRSERLGRRVIPRLTNAHNYGAQQNLGLYRFLCALPHQGRHPSFGLSWAGLDAAPFLPRVTTGSMVLTRARWRLARDELRRLGELEGSALFAAAQALRASRGFPRYLAVGDGDNEFMVDFDNVLSVESFVQLVKNRQAVNLLEQLVDEERCVTGPEGRYMHEVVLPFVSPVGAARPPQRAVAPRPTLERSFAPGTEWLYSKLYCAPSNADEVLRELVAPTVGRALGSKAAARWFFIRYRDPDFHLRLRLSGPASRLVGEVLPALSAAASPLLADGRLRRLELDTYDRELERYGGDAGMRPSEALFEADSQAALEIIDALNSDDSAADTRWRLALFGMDRLLDDLGFDLDARWQLMVRQQAQFFAELGVEGHYERPISARFRLVRRELEASFDPQRVRAGPLAPGFAAFARRSERVRPLGAELRALWAQGRLSTPLPDLAASYLHMHANRLFSSSPRAQEALLYDFLRRLYASRLARARPRSGGARAAV